MVIFDAIGVLVVAAVIALGVLRLVELAKQLRQPDQNKGDPN